MTAMLTISNRISLANGFEAFMLDELLGIILVWKNCIYCVQMIKMKMASKFLDSEFSTKIFRVLDFFSPFEKEKCLNFFVEEEEKRRHERGLKENNEQHIKIN